MIRQLKFFLTAFIFCSTFAFGQSDSCNLQISLLTCSPGAELYSAFGHTAIRVKDEQRGMDLVFNYGTFNDADPDFYINFTKGLMNYALSYYPFVDFIDEYQYEQRGVTEQELTLTCEEKQKLFEALRINTLEENRFYNYYFHSDNCTTRAKDMIAKNSIDSIQFKNILPPRIPTYRNLIHEYLDKGKQYWSKLGIDILLGGNLDKRVSNEQAMFLPDYLARGLDSAKHNGTSLVSRSPILLPSVALPDESAWFTPFSLFMLVFVVIAALSFYPKTRSTKLWLAFDFIFFMVLGLLGLLLCTLWIVRIDDVCRNNYNLLWALPLHIVTCVLVILKPKKWISTYFKIIVGLSLLLAAAWFFLPQQLNPALLPLLGVIVVRSYWLSNKKEKRETIKQ
ncbi:MAG: DUF4105 domain-containing protein [Bacteroidia bacterium]|nr:DUF4105 domain-containing protein [Bacteroidia bacterium]